MLTVTRHRRFKGMVCPFKKKKPLPRDMTRVQKRILTMKKPIALTPILSTQIRAYLQTVPETVQIYPMKTWHIFSDLGLKEAAFQKCLNAIVEAGLAEFKADAGTVIFNLNEKGRQWLEGGDL